MIGRRSIPEQFPASNVELDRMGGFRRCACFRAVLLVSLLAAAMLAPRPAAAQSVEDLQQLSISELANLDVSSVSKASQPLSEAPSSIYVITHDEIIRSGAVTLPEILRLAPNLFVAQTNATNYVITARGLSGNTSVQSFSDKLLVLIDGRTIYTPLFSGVYWDMQGVLPEDIDRIEVISGPGATLWGANAVNGVINIVTRKASDTQGGFAEVAGGNLERYGAVRYGGRIGENLSYRLYAQENYRTDTPTSAGGVQQDHFSRPQGGFRLDWTPGSKDLVTVQGDAYYGYTATATTIGGGNVTARWNHSWQDGSALQVQAFFDRVVRGYDLTGGTPLWQNIYDLDIQNGINLGSRQQLVVGGGLRFTQYRVAGEGGLQFSPSGRTLNLSDAFIQDSITLAQPLKLIIGLKLEDDPYSGVSALPSARLVFMPSQTWMLWAAASRAIRSPTPFDTDVQETVGGQLQVAGNPQFASEKLTAYEAGVRAQPWPRLSFSASAFFNVYNDLRSIEVTPVTLFPLYWSNGIQGHTYGFEGWAQYQAASWWRLMAGLDLLSEHLKFEPGATALVPISQDADDPKRQATLRSSMNLGPKITVDADLRYVGVLPDPHVPSYVELNGRVGWTIAPHLQLAVSGFNLLHAHHQETLGGEVARSVFAELRMHF